MKLRGFMLLALIAAYVVSSAQKIQFGLTAAINFSNVDGTGMSAKSQTGFEAGGFAAIPLTKKLSLQPELLYSYLKVSRSANFTTYYVNGSNAYSLEAFNLAYFSIPVLVNYSVSPKISVNAGPQYNILVYSNENLMYSKDAFKNSDAGIRGGVQFHPSPTFNLFASYYYGLTNINTIDDRYQWKNRQLQVGVNITLYTKK